MRTVLTRLFTAPVFQTDKELPPIPSEESYDDQDDDDYDPSPEEFGIYPALGQYTGNYPLTPAGNDASSFRLYTISERTERSDTVSSVYRRTPRAMMPEQLPAVAENPQSHSLSESMIDLRRCNLILWIFSVRTIHERDAVEHIV